MNTGKKTSSNANTGARLFSKILGFWNRNFRRIAIIFSCGLLVVYAGAIGIQMLAHALQFDGYAINGAFQAFNPLRRLAAGQVIGRDFQFFHGIGIPLMHYPFFRLLGGDLTAAELIRWSLLPLLAAGSVLLFFWAITKRLWLTLLAGSVTLLFFMWWLPAVIYPENSSLGLRSLTPVFVMVAILYKEKLSIHKIRWGINWYHLLISLLLALSFMNGTEHGVSAVLAFAAMSLRFPRMLVLKQRLFEACKVLSLSAAWLLVLLSVITLGHPLRPLKYALIDIPTDQAWYFGSPPNDFLQYSEWSNYVTARFNIVVVFATIIVLVTMYALRHKPFISDKVEAFTFGILTGAFALISMFGYYAPAQFIPLARMDILITVTLCVLILATLRPRFNKKNFLIYLPVSLLLIGLPLYISITTVTNLRAQFPLRLLAQQAYMRFITHTNHENLGIGWQATMQAIIPVVNADNYATLNNSSIRSFDHGVSPSKNAVLVTNDAYSALLHTGQVVYLPVSGRHRVAKIEKKQSVTIAYLETTKLINPEDNTTGRVIIGERLDKTNTKVWSTYTSLYEAEMGTIQPTPGYDYIIHALGNDGRKQYLAIFDKTQPPYAITIRPNYSYFEGWVQFTSWQFYQRLIDNYEPTTLTGSHVLWQRKPNQSWKKPDMLSDSQKLSVKGNRIPLPPNPSDKPQLAVITMNYSINGAATKLPILNKSPRYLLQPTHTFSPFAISLPPYMNQWSFPIYLNPNTYDANLDIDVKSLVPGAHLQITNATVQLPQIDSATIQALTDTPGPLKP